MHILSASRVLPFHGIGGMQAIAWDVLTELAQLGHRVTVLTTAVRNRPASWTEQGVTVVPLDGTSSERYSRNYWRATRNYLGATDAPVDAVLGISAGATGLLALREELKYIPFVCQLHGSSWGEAISKWRTYSPLEWAKSLRNVYWLAKDSALYRRYDALVLVGDVLARQFSEAPLSWMTSKLNKVVIPNGIDTRKFCPDSGARERARVHLQLRSNDKVLLFVARLHQQKGCNKAIETLAQLRISDPTYRLLIVGGGPAEQSLRQLANRLNCRDCVEFLGPQPRDLMPSLLNAADIFLFPSLRKEGLPMNVLEALSCGIPVLCSNELKEVFGPELPISYADPHSPSELAKAVIEIDKRFSEASRQINLTARFSLRQCALSYAQLLERLVALRRDTEAVV